MGLFDRFRPREVVLLYHRIARVPQDPWSLCVSPEHFVEHLQVLRRYQRIRLCQAGQARCGFGNPKLSVAITFDDGYADNLHEAARLLKCYDTPATFFLVTGYIGSAREFWWDELEKVILTPSTRCGSFRYSCDGFDLEFHPGVALSDYLWLYEKLQPIEHEARRRILDELLEWSGQSRHSRPSHRPLRTDEVIRLKEGDLFEIGAHTVTHPVLAAQSLDSQFTELRASKKQLEDLLDRPVTTCSYPYGGYGHYTTDTVRLAAAIGFKRACTTNASALRPGDSLHEIPRLNVTDVDGDQFERLLFA
jgi:peptidoglycan/xylan/chitin deacetylase (PgdA/CDA1 family)